MQHSFNPFAFTPPPLSLSLSLTLSLSLSLSHYLSVSLSVSLCLSLSVCLSVCLSLSLSLSLSLLPHPLSFLPPSLFVGKKTNGRGLSYCLLTQKSCYNVLLPTPPHPYPHKKSLQLCIVLKGGCLLVAKRPQPVYLRDGSETAAGFFRVQSC